MNEKFNDDFAIESYVYEKKSKIKNPIKQLDIFEDFLTLLEIPLKDSDKINNKIIQEYKRIPIKNILK